MLYYLANACMCSSHMWAVLLHEMITRFRVNFYGILELPGGNMRSMLLWILVQRLHIKAEKCQFHLLTFCLLGFVFSRALISQALFLNWSALSLSFFVELDVPLWALGTPLPSCLKHCLKHKEFLKVCHLNYHFFVYILFNRDFMSVQCSLWISRSN